MTLKKISQLHPSFTRKWFTNCAWRAFFHISGGGNKGSALTWLISCYAALWQQKPTLIAAGDGQNDIPMLEIANYAIVVRSPTNPPLALPWHQAVTITDACGPLGWNHAMLNLISTQLTKTQH